MIDLLNKVAKIIQSIVIMYLNECKTIAATSGQHKDLAADFIQLCRDQAKLRPINTPTIKIIIDALITLECITIDPNEYPEQRKRAQAILTCKYDTSSELYKTIHEELHVLIIE